MKGTEVEEVSNFLTSIECPSVECEKVSNENSRFDSFKVKLKEEFCLKLTSDEAKDLLPPNVMRRRFYGSRKKEGSSFNVKDGWYFLHEF